KGLFKHCPKIAPGTGLVKAVAALRHGTALQPKEKVLIVLDQFEQWLHAWHEPDNAELVQALRQCDGARVQCLILVRDDFWMACTRLFRQLEIPLEEAEN